MLESDYEGVLRGIGEMLVDIEFEGVIGFTDGGCYLSVFDVYGLIDGEEVGSISINGGRFVVFFLCGNTGNTFHFDLDDPDVFNKVIGVFQGGNRICRELARAVEAGVDDFVDARMCAENG